MKARTIEWREGRYSAWRGYVANIEVVSVHYGSARADAKPWKLATTLPLVPKVTDYLTRAEAQEAGQTFLDAFARWLTRAEAKP